MQLGIETQVEAAPALLIERLHDIASWPEWMEGLQSVEVVRPGAHAEVVLVFGNPRQFSVRMDIDCQDGGVFCSLIEGEVTGVQVDLRIEPGSKGSQIRWDIYLHFPLTVPGALLTELRTSVVPRWSRALAR